MEDSPSTTEQPKIDPQLAAFARLNRQFFGDNIRVIDEATGQEIPAATPTDSSE